MAQGPPRRSPGELNHALLHAGGPTQSQLSRPMLSGHHISMEHRLRIKHLYLNTNTNASKENFWKEEKKKAKEKQEKWKSMKDEQNERTWALLETMDLWIWRLDVCFRRILTSLALQLCPILPSLIEYHFFSDPGPRDDHLLGGNLLAEIETKLSA